MNYLNRNQNINLFFKFAILIKFIILSNPVFSNRILFWLSTILILVSIIWIVINSGLRLTHYIIWIFLFSIIVIASSLWAHSIEYSIDVIKSLFSIYLVLIFISILIEDRKDFYEVLKLFLYSQIVTAITIIMSIDTSLIGIVRIGSDILGEGWNANAIGMNMAIAAFLALTLIYFEQKTTLKVLYFVLILFLIYISFMTGSRKAFFVLVFSLGFSYVFNSSTRFKKYNKFFFATLSVILVFYIVMDIPALYTVLGSRIESLIARFTGQGIVDKSIMERNFMIEYGLYLWKQKPIFGYGVNNFRELFGSIAGGRYTYSHNNYVELLVSMGILGIAIYYSSFLYIIFNSFRRNHILLIFSFISVITIIFIDYGLVSYYSFYIQFLICLSFAAVQVYKNERITSNKKLN